MIFRVTAFHIGRWKRESYGDRNTRLEAEALLKRALKNGRYLFPKIIEVDGEPESTRPRVQLDARPRIQL